MNPDTSAARKLETERDCRALTLRFFEGLDDNDPATCLGCFDAEGVWERQGEGLRGHGAIEQALRSRPADRRTAHVVSNVRVELESTDTAVVSFLLVTYEGSAPPGAADPVARLAGVRRCRDELRLAADGWKIVRKTSRGLFKAAPALTGAQP